MRVVIVGAGPAGAALAYLLARAGADVTLVERQSDFAREFRGEGLMPSGADALVQMGLGVELEALPQSHVTHLRLWRDGAVLLELPVAAAAADAPIRMVSQPAMLEMLVAQASRYPSFRFERGVTVRESLHAAGRVVGVHVESTSGARDLHADLVIGADGRTSVLRRRAGLPEVSQTQTFDVIWCKVPLPAAWAAEHSLNAFLGRGHAALCFRAWDDRLQIGWIIAKGAFGDLKRRGVEAWMAELAAHVGPVLGPHLLAHGGDVTHPFLLDVVCGRVRRWTAPGLLLLGDAAHPMSPVGAQGINLALRDSLVAANHLVPLAATPPDAAAIDRAAAAVEVERTPEIVAIQRLQQVPPVLMFQEAWWSGLVLRALPLLVRSGILPLALGAAIRRITRGVVPIRLQA
jgi:2-polyprenyl-6-methoxyphenol hydroxylase-like FAD-dependent oxidoreductase